MAQNNENQSLMPLTTCKSFNSVATCHEDVREVTTAKSFVVQMCIVCKHNGCSHQHENKVPEVKDDKLEKLNEQQVAELSAMRERIQQLENESSKQKNQILSCEEQIRQRDAFIAQKSAALEESFVIHKEPFVDRHKWALTMWSQLDLGNQLANQVSHPLVRTWFELECQPQDERMVYMLGSFFNWECAILLNKMRDGKFGIWIDLPPGRHEFRYLVDGTWRTSDDHGRCRNDFGTENNWREVTDKEACSIKLDKNVAPTNPPEPALSTAHGHSTTD